MSVSLCVSRHKLVSVYLSIKVSHSFLRCKDRTNINSLYLFLSKSINFVVQTFSQFNANVLIGSDESDTKKSATKTWSHQHNFPCK